MKDAIAASYTAQVKREFNLRRAPDRRHVCIVGASHGNIGGAIAKHLVDCDVEPLDIADLDITKTAVLPCQPDTLIICAGYSRLDWFENMPEDAARRTFETNLIGPYLLAQAWVSVMLREFPELHKKLIFIGSMAYRAVLNASAAYCASKAGLAHLASCLAWELAPKGFDVYCIHPSNTVGTPMTEETIVGIMRYRGISRDAAEQYWSAVCPMPEFLTPEEIARVVEFIMGNSYLAGSNIELRGAQR